jgi:aminoacylase
MNKLLNFREEQKKVYDADDSLNLGDVTTVNLTYMSGGVQMNVVPNEFTVGFDLRITPSTSMETFEAMLDKWVAEAGKGIEVVYEQKFTDQTLTNVAKDDPWFQAFMRAAVTNGLDIAPRIFPAGTDSRYIREVGIPAFGFSPMNNTPVLLHDHNEFLNENVFLRGIDIFVDVIDEMASV